MITLDPLRYSGNNHPISISLTTPGYAMYSNTAMSSGDQDIGHLWGSATLPNTRGKIEGKLEKTLFMMLGIWTLHCKQQSIDEGCHLFPKSFFPLCH